MQHAVRGQVLDWFADWEGPQILCAANLLCDLLDAWQRQRETSGAIEDVPMMGHQDVWKIEVYDLMSKPKMEDGQFTVYITLCCSMMLMVEPYISKNVTHPISYTMRFAGFNQVFFPCGSTSIEGSPSHHAHRSSCLWKTWVIGCLNYEKAADHGLVLCGTSMDIPHCSYRMSFSRSYSRVLH